ncbi:MAG: diacylglycerol kinase family lipid kinase [Calditrichaeota bacterium]|nr:diacylglycerol kinase family lipid kinase [Calditrichota bacterium]
MKYSLIINPNSGKDRSKFAIVSLIKKFNKDVDILFTKHPGHAGKLAKKSASEKKDIVIAAGGDGTINEIASALLHTNTSLGIIPLGSGNGYARSLDIPLKPYDAMNVIFKKNKRLVDVGEINEKYFFAVAGVGLDASIGQKFQQHHTRGALPYFYLGLKSYFEYDYPKFNLKINDEIFNINPTLITIANAKQFGNGAIIAPQADIQDGLLDICILEKMSIIQSLDTVLKLFNGKIEKAGSYKSYRCNKLEISSEHRLNYHIDGEPFQTDVPLKIGIAKEALSVICPTKD